MANAKIFAHYLADIAAITAADPTNLPVARILTTPQHSQSLKSPASLID